MRAYIGNQLSYRKCKKFRNQRSVPKNVQKKHEIDTREKSSKSNDGSRRNTKLKSTCILAESVFQFSIPAIFASFSFKILMAAFSTANVSSLFRVFTACELLLCEPAEQ